MQLSLSIDSIYQGALCKLISSAHYQYEIRPSAHVVAILKGIPTIDNFIKSSEEKGGRNNAEFIMSGTLYERKTDHNLSGSASRYGMSYFPFISTEFMLRIETTGKIADITIEVPSAFRVMWSSVKAVSSSGEFATLATSFSEKSSTYVLSWPESSDGAFDVKFSIRTGGPFLLRTTYFPIYYYAIALLAVAAAAGAEHINILLTAIAASWVFLLRHLNTCDLPKRSVLLFYVAMAMGLFLPIWGVAWRGEPSSYSFFYLPALSVLVATFIYHALTTIRKFEANGSLPKWLINAWGKLVQRQEGD